MKRKQELEPVKPSPFHYGRTWSKGSLIGRGSFGSVFVATLKKPISPNIILPPFMAVKSAEVSVSDGKVFVGDNRSLHRSRSIKESHNEMIKMKERAMMHLTKKRTKTIKSWGKEH
ncbi:hypothetical protein L1049_019860 [Liquidambar formosana]|uniref:Uncharacterized protein n=1 Tax=Liquidambar formosana TaxID=63359 RepID=A0AAP0X388_LIQFO